MMNQNTKNDPYQSSFGKKSVVHSLPKERLVSDETFDENRALAQNGSFNGLDREPVHADNVERSMIFESKAMAEVVRNVNKVADSNITVLISGETGTGKELVARLLHARSARVQQPFVAVHAGAMPASLVESELFGHSQGAFTGAKNARTGRFRHANKGTLFLDEISELSQELQPKLLRVLQEKTVDVVGADIPVTVDVRVVAATNRNLDKEVKAGRFREDLFYRVNVFEINVPPLRERKADIEPLARYFVARYAHGRELSISDDVLDCLYAHDWPGNIRELENVIQRLVILAEEDKINRADIPFFQPNESIDKEDSERDGFGFWPPFPAIEFDLVKWEKRVIKRAMTINNNNITKAAAYLKLRRHVLDYRLRKHGLAK